jgi:hypothetical protein
MADLGEAYMLRKPGQQTEQLWVLVTGAPDNGQAIMVNITTLRERSDTTTVLGVGDHPFITRPSVVFYADARPVDPGDLDRAVAAGCGRTHGPLRPRCWRASRPAWSFRRLRRTR